MLFFEVAFEGDEGAAFEGDFAKEFADLFAVEEEAADAFGVVVFAGGFVVGGDVELVEPSLFFFDAGKGVVEVALTFAEGFDFGAEEFDAGFDGV